jgi:TRAP-type mannitol/chloroaromatic compound transport system permease large subunit
MAAHKSNYEGLNILSMIFWFVFNYGIIPKSILSREFCDICILLSAIRYIITLKNVIITDYVCYVTGFCAASKDEMGLLQIPTKTRKNKRVEDKLDEYVNMYNNYTST